MKLRVTFFVVLLVASMFAAVFTLSDVHARPPPLYGPRIDHLRFFVEKALDRRIWSMQLYEIDVLTHLTRPTDITTLVNAGKKMLSTPGDHFCYVCFNMRPYRTSVPPKALPFGPQSSGEPGRSLRHAIAHLVPKAELIGSLLGCVATQIEVPMSGSLGTFGADIDTHPYNPTMANQIMLAGGWTWDGSAWHVPATVPADYPLPPSSMLPNIEIMSPTLETAPTSWSIAETTAQNMLNIGINVGHSEYDLTTMIDLIDARNYEMYLLEEEDMGRFGDHLYDFFHSANNIPSGLNRLGLSNTTLDAVLWDMYTTLDKTYMEEKVAECLEMLMGTSAYSNTPLTDGIIPCIPIYSQNYFDAYSAPLYGMVNAKLKGSWNYWTTSNMYWEPGFERPSDLVPDGPMVIFCQGENFQYPANPAWVSSTVTWDMLDYIYESLIGTNPYNLQDTVGWLDLTRDPDPNTTPGFKITPWTVTDGPAAGANGMKVTFYLNTTVARPWHDGHIWDAYDVAFAWEYLTANKIPRAWDTFKWFHHCTIEDAGTVTAYMTTTGLTIPYGLSEWSSMFPEHVWGCTMQRGGRATPSCVTGPTHTRKEAWNAILPYINSGAVQGTAGFKLAGDPDANADSGLCLCPVGTQGAGGKLTCIDGSGCVIDDWRTTAQNEILDYDPAAYAHGTTAYPWLSEQIGTGPWVFYQINVAVGRGDLIAFGYGVTYPKTNNEIRNEMVEMFWECGDVDLNGEIRIIYDLAIQGANYFKTVPPAPARADINKDNIVDIRDLAYGGLNYGREREVLP